MSSLSRPGLLLRALPAPRPLCFVVTRASFASGRWAHKCEVDGNLLLEEFCAIRVFDCFLGFIEGVVLDEDVALQKSAIVHYTHIIAKPSGCVAQQYSSRTFT
jgi:hypothetical protein